MTVFRPARSIDATRREPTASHREPAASYRAPAASHVLPARLPRRLALGWVALAWVALGYFGLGYFALGCSPRVAASGPRRAPQSSADFAFSGVDGQVISDEVTAGRVTVLLFATTFDLDSQTQAKLLEDLVRTHAPRVNAVLVFLEAPQYVDLARSFRDVLRLSYPVALADSEELRAGGRLPAVVAVPTWIVIDRASKVRAHYEGAVDSGALLELVERAE